MKLYMKTTTDKYELPIAVSESPDELAEMIGIKKTSLMCAISNKVKGYHRIEIDEEWWPDNDGGLWRWNEDGEIEYMRD